MKMPLSSNKTAAAHRSNLFSWSSARSRLLSLPSLSSSEVKGLVGAAVFWFCHRWRRWNPSHEWRLSAAGLPGGRARIQKIWSQNVNVSKVGVTAYPRPSGRLLERLLCYIHLTPSQSRACGDSNWLQEVAMTWLQWKLHITGGGKPYSQRAHTEVPELCHQRAGRLSAERTDPCAASKPHPAALCRPHPKAGLSTSSARPAPQLRDMEAIIAAGRGTYRVK